MQNGRRWDLWLAALGFALATVDFAVFAVLGIEMNVADRNVDVPVFLFFALSYAAFGFIGGKLIQARAQAKLDAATIKAQVLAREAAQRALAQEEKLAGIGRMAAGVAHEVRNPLGVIRSSAAMVQESFDPGEEPHRACGFILEEIDRLDGLIRSLLTFARPAELRSEEVSIEKSIDRALNLADGAITRRGIQVEREAKGSVPTLRADPDLISQIILDLLQNACEAAGNAGTIALLVSREGDQVHVDVWDSGPGIPKDDRAKVFEPFFTTKATGTGLGLPMASRFAQAHGGSLDLMAPRDGELLGGHFRLRLPIDGPRLRVSESAVDCTDPADAIFGATNVATKASSEPS